MTSKIKTQVELSAPQYPICKEETIRGNATTCNLCNGAGGKYIDSRCPKFLYSKNKGSGYYEACKVCKGSGFVYPVVSIEWKSAGEIMEKYKTAIGR